MRQLVSRNIVNCLSAKIKRKLIVIESDDWGAIRMPSKEVYDRLLRKNIIHPSDVFAKYDSLASEDDFTHFFEIIQSVKDSYGNHPIFTANCAVANPDFDKIRASNYQTYHYESIQETYKRYPRHTRSFVLWKEGVSKKLFFPQYHCREHVNVPAWMNILRQQKSEFHEAFDLGTYAIDKDIVASLKVHTQEQQDVVNDIIKDGFLEFRKLFGFDTKSFIAPNYTWNDSVENVLHNLGIKLLQGSKRQNVPVFGKLKNQARYHYTGQTNKNGQVYLVRNCLFEPSISPKIDYASVCLKHVENAFCWGAPAIIGTHRLNYIGYLDEENRIRNLKSLKSLLSQLIKKHPTVEFVTTPQLETIFAK